MVICESMINSNTTPIGSVVTLKSGGPKMTLEDYRELNRGVITAMCMWFHEYSAVRRYEFPLACLTLVSENPKTGAVNQ